MNYLANKRLYLSGAIEHDSTSMNWRTEPKKVLTEQFGLNLFDPFDDPKQQWTGMLHKARETKDYDTMVHIAKSFVRKDLAIVDRSDIVVAYLPYKVPTTGTHHEIIVSSNAKKPTLLVCPQGKEYVPLWYFGFIPVRHMFGNWESLYKYLQEVDDGLYQDDRRWSFVYGLL